MSKNAATRKRTPWECPICFLVGPPLMCNQCGKNVCANCVKKLTTKTTCPMCCKKQIKWLENRDFHEDLIRQRRLKVQKQLEQRRTPPIRKAETEPTATPPATRHSLCAPPVLHRTTRILPSSIPIPVVEGARNLANLSGGRILAQQMLAKLSPAAAEDVMAMRRSMPSTQHSRCPSTERITEIEDRMKFFVKNYVSEEFEKRKPPSPPPRPLSPGPLMFEKTIPIYELGRFAMLSAQARAEALIWRAVELAGDALEQVRLNIKKSFVPNDQMFETIAKVNERYNRVIAYYVSAEDEEYWSIVFNAVEMRKGVEKK